MTQPAVSSKPWLEIFLVLVAVSVGVAVRLYQVSYNFDCDEIFSARLASGSLTEVISQSLTDRPHPPLHNLLLFVWVHAFGASETSTRMLSVAIAGAFMVTAYFLFRRLMPFRSAIAAMALLATSPFFVYYGQQARPYSLIALLATANLLAFVSLLKSPLQRRLLWLWATSCTALLYSQYLGGLLIAAEVTFAIFTLKTNRVKVALFGVTSIALIAPWFFAAAYRPLLAGNDPLPHINWINTPTAADFVWFYLSVFGSTPWLRFRWLLLVLFPAGAWFLWTALRERTCSPERLFLLAVAFGIPPIVFAISVLGPKPVFADRQMIGCYVAFFGAIGLFASSLPRRLDIPFFCALMAWTITAIPQAFPQHSKPPSKQVALDLNAQYGSERVVALEDWVAGPTNFYRGKNRVRLFHELSDDEKKQRFLLLCRPFRDSDPEIAPVRVDREPLASWNWGWEISEENSKGLNLYEIHPDVADRRKPKSDGSAPATRQTEKDAPPTH